MKSEAALKHLDSLARRCRYCGTWTNKRNQLCQFCDEHGWPTTEGYIPV